MKEVQALALVGLVLMGGCVWKSDYDALESRNSQLQSQNQQLSSQNQQLQADVVRLQNAIKYTVNSDLLFPSGSWEMSRDGQEIIARLASELAPTQRNKLMVNGYTDNKPVGPALQKMGVADNVVLSQKRAEAVREYLISRGVNPNLIGAKGWGEQQAVAPNTTPEGRAQNRRVEITLAGAT